MIPLRCNHIAVVLLELNQNTSDIIERSTLHNKLMLGYQGWFGYPGDGSLPLSWKHWFRTNDANATHLTVDLWPDTTGFDESELFGTQMTKYDGSPAMLYSAYNCATIARHFKWLRDYGLDGVMLQRFLCELSTAEGKDFRDRVTTNVESEARATGRVFCIMYDVSESNEGTLVDDLRTDWDHPVNDKQITQSPRYLYHNGKPLLAIFGLGFKDRPGTAAQARAIIDYFHADAQVTLLGGVPADWRTLSGECKTDTPDEWRKIFASFDVLSPWFVGHSDAGTESFTANYVIPRSATPFTRCRLSSSSFPRVLLEESKE